MKPEIIVNVALDNFSKFETNDIFVQQISFHGTFSCDFGTGIIMPGAVDTQTRFGDEACTLSARYILEGKDEAGTIFHIYVENNGSIKDSEIIDTIPIIHTDYPQLKYLENNSLVGKVIPQDEGVQILLGLEKNSMR